jgi:hypothetical protein
MKFLKAIIDSSVAFFVCADKVNGKYEVLLVIYQKLYKMEIGKLDSHHLQESYN